MQLELDIVDRLRAEVADVQQVLLTTRHQLRYRVNALALEAVVRPDSQVQVLNRQREVRGQLLVDRRRPDLDAFGLHVQLASQTEQLNERTTSGGNCVARTDCLLGFHRSEEHTSELQSQSNLVCRLLLEK